MEHFAKYVLDRGGVIKPLLIPGKQTNGTGLMNPSILNRDGKIIVNIRHVNYTFYHSEKKLFQHPFGPLTYLHPENDMHLRTWNLYGELDDDLNLTRVQQIDTSKFPEQEKWDFVGLEDVRLMEWDGHLYTTGVRRDLKPNGEGRMELCEIVVDDENVTEVSRFRIPPPNDPNSYCEKNWMPILDQPYRYVKWSNPIEVVEVDPVTQSCKTVHLGKYDYIPRDLRGGSQIVPIDDEHYLALTHEVDLFNSEVGRKDALYRHRFVMWDRDWNLKKYTDDFSIMAGDVEFAVGMCIKGDDVLITFGWQDNAAYVLKTPYNVLMDYINESNRHN
jgi:hypothetical protein